MNIPKMWAFDSESGLNTVVDGYRKSVEGIYQKQF